MRKVERIARGRTRRAESAMARQVFAALNSLRHDMPQMHLDRAPHRGDVPVESLPNRLAPAMQTVRKAFLQGWRDGKALVTRG